MAKKCTTQPQHGGAREGSGRKAEYARAVVKKTLALPEDGWEQLDAKRGDIPMAKYIMQRLGIKPQPAQS